MNAKSWNPPAWLTSSGPAGSAVSAVEHGWDSGAFTSYYHQVAPVISWSSNERPRGRRRPRGRKAPSPAPLQLLCRGAASHPIEPFCGGGRGTRCVRACVCNVCTSKACVCVCAVCAGVYAVCVQCVLLCVYVCAMYVHPKLGCVCVCVCVLVCVCECMCVHPSLALNSGRWASPPHGLRAQLPRDLGSNPSSAPSCCPSLCLGFLTC